jgi:hypothetical protein
LPGMPDPLFRVLHAESSGAGFTFRETPLDTRAYSSLFQESKGRSLSGVPSRKGGLL